MFDPEAVKRLAGFAGGNKSEKPL